MLIQVIAYMLLIFAIPLTDGHYEDDPAACHGGISGRQLPQTPGDSEEDFKLACKWLNDCLSNHILCPKSSIEISLPRRIIDVGPPDGTVEPCLLESDQRKGLYITLSHCWGGKVPLTTRTDTLEQRKRSILLTSLPKTFRDAVVITRKLGIRYLWIDSLCILQDSATDWAIESAAMGDIYGSGLLNIAARGAVNAQKGCFISREAEPLPCVLKYCSFDGSIAGSMYIRSPAFQTERLQDAPLDQRGWILQERLLSARILYFGCQQMYWECAESTLRQDGKHCDVLTDGLREDLDFKASLHFDASSQSSSKLPEASNDQECEHAEVAAKTFLQWYKVVRQYTRRNLTFESDKLPAISGIAKSFQAKTGCTYIAGIWKEDLIAGIAWCLSQPSDEIISRTLPSWSWARVKGEVHFWSNKRGQVALLDGSCELDCVAYKPAGELCPYGDVVDTKLQVRGRLIQVRYRPPEPPDNNFLSSIFALDSRPIGRISFDSLDFNPDSPAYFFCLLLHGGDHYAAALALQLEEDHNEALYKRIGYVLVDSFKGATIDGRTPFWQSEPQIIAIR